MSALAHDAATGTSHIDETSGPQHVRRFPVELLARCLELSALGSELAAPTEHLVGQYGCHEPLSRGEPQERRCRLLSDGSRDVMDMMMVAVDHAKVLYYNISQGKRSLVASRPIQSFAVPDRRTDARN